MDFPGSLVLPRDVGVISTWMLGSLGPGAGNIGVVSGTHPAANRAIFVPFRNSEPMLVRQLAHYNGSAVSGNIDVGIYDHRGTRLISAGSTAQSGTSVWQLFDVTDTTIGAGLFYFAVALDNTTGTSTRHNLATSIGQLLGCMQMASAFPLPATATFAAIAATGVPSVVATGRTVF